MRLLLRFAAIAVAVILACRAPSLASNAINANDPHAVQQAISDAYQAGQKSIVIPPGVYKLRPAGAASHLSFIGMKHFLIDATGVTFVSMVAGRTAIDFRDCEDVTLRGATLLRGTVPTSQGTVEAIDPDRWWADVRVHAGYSPDLTDGAMLYTYAAGSRVPKTTVPMLFGGPEHLSKDLIRFHLNKTGADNSNLVVGDRVAWRGQGASDVSLRNCSKMRIERVKILGGAGFCMYETGGDGGNYYNYTVSYPPKPDGAAEEPLLASNADAFHSNMVRGGPTLDNCLFEGIGDDGIPIHGTYAYVMETTGNKVIIDAPTPDWGRPGDTLHIIGDDRSIIDTAKIVSVEKLDDYEVKNTHRAGCRYYMLQGEPIWQAITLDKAVPMKFGWYLGNVNGVGSGFHISHCTVRNSRTRAMLIKASDGVIEDNTIENTEGGIIVVPELDIWAESDFSHNLTIRNNTIRSTGTRPAPDSSQVGALTIAAYEQDKYVPRPGGHDHIVATGNTFEGNGGANIVISSASDIAIKDNLFLRPMPAPSDRGVKTGVDPTSLVWITQSIRVALSGNRVREPGPNLRKLVTATSTASGTGFTEGVRIVK